MECTLWLLEKILAFWVQLAFLRTEVVVYRSALEDALFYSFSLSELVVIYLNDNTQTFYKEDIKS